MTVILFSALGALLLASANTINKLGMRSTSVAAGTVISLTAGMFVLLTIVLVDPPEAVEASALPFLILAGIIGSAIGRGAVIGGIDRLGPSTAVPIQSSTYPLLAVAGGVLLLGESLTILRCTGVLVIISGLVVLSRRNSQGPKGRSHDVRALAFPVIAGLAFGAADLFRKHGVDLLPEPAFAEAIGAVSAAVALNLLAVSSKMFRSRIVLGPSMYWFVLSGILSSLGLLSSMYALSTGEVSVVSPILASQPLLVVGLSALLLKGLEQVTLRVFVAAVLTVSGVLILSIS
jgi:DME family drug/metabolite transporter